VTRNQQKGNAVSITEGQTVVDEVEAWLDEIESLRNATLCVLMQPQDCREARFDAVADLLHAACGLRMELVHYVEGDTIGPNHDDEDTDHDVTN
jgi:hypothetical protein